MFHRRSTWRPALLMLAMIWLTALAKADPASPLILGDQGKTEYQIVLPTPGDHDEVNQGLAQSARLLQAGFKANGIEIAVVTEPARDPAKPGIYLGQTALATRHGIDTAAFAGWTFLLQALGRDIIVAGRDHPAPKAKTNQGSQSHARIATAKAVTLFMHQYLGTRFLYPELQAWSTLAAAGNIDWLTNPAVEFLPMPRITVPADLRLQRTPVMEFDITYPPVVSFYHLSQNRFPLVDSISGGHTWHRAIPPETYAKTNPEYFALLGGSRYTQGHDANAQYCISNPQVQDLMARDLAYWFTQGFHTADLGQPDGFRPCQCQACNDLFGTGQDWNEKIWILHRNLAQQMHQAFPGRVVVISSYIQTADPPKTFKVFPPNVRLLLTGTNDSDFAPWREVVVPQGFSSYLYNWTANLVPRFVPMRTPLYVQTQAQRLVTNRIRSIMRDGNGGVVYGMEGPTYYTMGRLYENPEQFPAKEFVHEFIEAAFGRAAHPMQRFYDQLFHGIELHASYTGTREVAWAYRDIYGGGRKLLSDPFQMTAFLLAPDLMAALDETLKQAEAVTDAGPKVAMRLALVRREFDYLNALSQAVHLYRAYQAVPDAAILDRLLNVLDARNELIKSYFVKGNQLAGWSHELYPPPGHNIDHMMLNFEGYQEPWKDTFLNWDTQARRRAPLASARQMDVLLTDASLTLDSPQWQAIKPQTLAALNPGAAPAGEVRMMYDEQRVYIRLDCPLPADSTEAGLAQHRADVTITPTTASPITYRFTAGHGPDTRLSAARGFIDDAMDPRYGKFDPDWKGAWSHDSRFDRETRRWSVMLTLPLSTMQAASPTDGVTWYANFRILRLGTDPAIWSPTTGVAELDDPRNTGMLTFRTSAVRTPPLKKWRSEYYRSTFEVPADWRAQTDRGPVLPELTGWLFRPDPADRGMTQQWFKADAFKLAEWTPIAVPSFWAENDAVGDVRGIGWYRVTFRLPTEFKGKGLRILFASVDEEAWVYLDGRLVREHSMHSEGKSFELLWEEPFIAEIPAADLRPGADHVLMVRVNNSAANGGIWRPVLGAASP
jgi:hypothetical protein